MPYIKVRDDEPFEIALRRFKRVCEKSGILSEVRKREAYEKPTTIRKRKKLEARRRQRKKQQTVYRRRPVRRKPATTTTTYRKTYRS